MYAIEPEAIIAIRASQHPLDGEIRKLSARAHPWGALKNRRAKPIPRIHRASEPERTLDVREYQQRIQTRRIFQQVAQKVLATDRVHLAGNLPGRTNWLDRVARSINYKRRERQPQLDCSFLHTLSQAVSERESESQSVTDTKAQTCNARTL
jgi:hypothetical protein